jgi:hypothetical protein
MLEKTEGPRSGMENPETQSTLGTRHGRTKTNKAKKTPTMKTKKMNKTDHIKKEDINKLKKKQPPKKTKQARGCPICP